MSTVAVPLTRWLKAALRIGVTVGALWYTFTLMPLAEIWPLLRHSDWRAVLLALAGVQLAHVIIAARLHAFVLNARIAMPFGRMVVVHYVSSLFATVLPGAIGGDAYKVWWLRKHTHLTTAPLVRMVLGARASGLWMLINIAVLCAAFSSRVAAHVPHLAWWLIGSVLFVTICYLLALRFLLKQQRLMLAVPEAYSFLGQVVFALVAYLLLLALHPHDGGLNAAWLGLANDYVMLFMLSCVVAMFPLSIGGIGLREFTFLHAAPILGLSAAQGVALALAFTLVNLTVAIIGGLLHLIGAEKTSQMLEATA